MDSSKIISGVILDSLQTLYTTAIQFTDSIDAKISAQDESLAQLAKAYEVRNFSTSGPEINSCDPRCLDH